MAKDVFNLVGTTLANKYAIEALVAAGGFGVVYRARHTELETPAAVKVLHITRGAEEAARVRFLKEFKQEAQLVARLNHPAIARVLDFGVAEMPDGERAPWMALEWVEGRTLKEDLVERRDKGGRAPAECLALLRPILEALAHAHEEGVVHRDIKPANMILTAPRAVAGSIDGRARRAASAPMRLLDFGIAKIMRPDEELPSGETSTSAEALQFTTAYAAPEQVGGKRTGPWTDVHALALVLVEMLTDQRAYPGADNVELLRHIVALERPTPARRFGVDVGAWEPVLARALAPSPADRYADAGELLAALEANVPANIARASVRPEVSVPTETLSTEVSGRASVTATTESTSTTSPTVSDARVTRSEPAGAPPWHAKPRVRYGALGALGALALAVVAALAWPRAGAPVAVSPPARATDHTIVREPTRDPGASRGGSEAPAPTTTVASATSSADASVMVSAGAFVDTNAAGAAGGSPSGQSRRTGRHRGHRDHSSREEAPAPARAPPPNSVSPASVAAAQPPATPPSPGPPAE